MADTEITGESLSELVARGSRALETIRMRERAARYAADALELEQAISRARQGSSTELVRWMARWGNDSECPSAVPNHDQSWREDVHRTESRRVGWEQSPGAPWERMLEGLRERVQSRLAQRPKASLLTAPNREKPDEGSSHHDRDDSEADTSSPSDLLRLDRPPSAPPTDARVGQIAVPIFSGSATLRAKVCARSSPNPIHRKVPSWMISSFLHGGLLLGLAVVTIRSMEPDRVLAIQAAMMEGEEVSLEMPPLSDAEILESEWERMESNSLAPTLASPSPLSDISGSLQGILEQANEAASGGESALLHKQLQQSGGQESFGEWSRNAASAQFFGVQAVGNNFCYIVDSSASMRRDGAFDAAKRELIRSIAALKPTQRFYVYFFSDEIEALTLRASVVEPRPVYATKENVQSAMEWIERVRIRGGKSPIEVLGKAIELDPDGIFLLFDGDTRVDVAKYLQKANRVFDVISGSVPRVPIHTVGFFSQEFEPSLRRIAEENRGTYRFVPSPKRSSSR